VTKDIFLCHTGADKDWVEELAKRLEDEPVADRKIGVWFDKWDIDGGENLLDKIEAGLKSSRFVGVVLSPAMTRAEWPKLEWQSQVYEDPAGRKARILPILRHQTRLRVSRLRSPCP
jgi:RNA-directed DNA polymerase